jgi:hypothetical protein
MNKKITATEVILIGLWALLFMNASSIQGKLLFGMEIQTHLIVLGALIVVSSIARRLVFVKTAV